MSVETKEQILEKLERSRRLLGQAPDPKTTASLRAYIEELEARLFMMTGKPT
jgi:DNA-binding ferritin-like protein